MKPFWSRVKVLDEKSCWEWQGPCYKHGYGKIGIIQNGRRVNYAHRFAYEDKLGKIPDGLFVLHKCDNKKCCNPSHLFLGTDLDNLLDSLKKGLRHVPKGMEHCRAKLTNDDVRRIRYLATIGRTYRDLSKQFGVSCGRISDIVNYHTWKHI